MHTPRWDMHISMPFDAHNSGFLVSHSRVTGVFCCPRALFTQPSTNHQLNVSVHKKSPPKFKAGCIKVRGIYLRLGLTSTRSFFCYRADPFVLNRVMGFYSDYRFSSAWFTLFKFWRVSVDESHVGGTCSKYDKDSCFIDSTNSYCASLQVFGRTVLKVAEISFY